MRMRPAEARDVHTRLLKCALQVEDSRAYWSRWMAAPDASADTAFSEFWFGSKSLSRVKVLLTNFRARFDAFPAALAVLSQWEGLPPDARAVICHWHLQLADPLYRRFTGIFLPRRIDDGRPELTHARVVDWVSDQGESRWTMATRRQFASKLLSSARTAGLVRRVRDPRQLVVPHVPDEAVTYLVYLLREVEVEQPVLDNPYLRSVGLTGSLLADRLRSLESVAYAHQAGVVHLTYRFDSLLDWAQATVAPGLADRSVP